jgi:hypothetical protein
MCSVESDVFNLMINKLISINRHNRMTITTSECILQGSLYAAELHVHTYALYALSASHSLHAMHAKNVMQMFMYE